MVTLQTYIVYSSLFILMYILCKQGAKYKSGGFIGPIVAVMLYAIIFGLRYGVGVDHIEYLNDYITEQINGSINPNDDTEIGYIKIRSFFSLRGLHYSWYFAFIAFAQLIFVFLSVKKDREVLQYLTLSFGLMCIWLSYANGLRQQLAFCIFTLILSLLSDKKNLIWIILLLLCAISIHKSASLLIGIIILLLLFKKEWFSNVILQLIMLGIAIIVGLLPITQNLISFSEGYMQLWEYSGYDVYFEEEFAHLMLNTSSHRGAGFYVHLLIDIALIMLSRKVKTFCSSLFLNRAYNLYFIGVLIHYALIASPMIGRINYYLYGFNFIIMAYTLYTTNKCNKNLFYFLLGIITLCFIGYLYRMYDNTAAYYFVWQQDLYNIK